LNPLEFFLWQLQVRTNQTYAMSLVKIINSIAQIQAELFGRVIEN
jgi:hypothetical protein